MKHKLLLLTFFVTMTYFVTPLYAGGWDSARASGGVTTPASSTDNAMVRFDGTTGAIFQDSQLSVGDTGVLKLWVDALAYMTITPNDGGGITFDSVSDGTAKFTFSDIVEFGNGDIYFEADGDLRSATTIKLLAYTTTGGGFQCSLSDDLANGDLFEIKQLNSNMELTDTDGVQSLLAVSGEFAQSGTATAYGLKVDMTNTSLGDGTTGLGNNLALFCVNGTEKAAIDVDGKLTATAAHYGEMYMYDSAATQTIDTSAVYHLMRNFSTGSVESFTFNAGSTGAITAYADYSGTVPGTVSATSNTHNLATGDDISITGTTNYNGVFTVTVIDANTFYFTDTWVADDATGTWSEGSYIEASTAGVYFAIYSISADSVNNNKVFKYELFVNSTEQNNTAVERNYAVGTDLGNSSGQGIITLAVGDRIYLGCQNNTDTDNLNLQQANVTITKIQ